MPDPIQREAVLGSIRRDFVFAYEFVNQGHTPPAHAIRWNEIADEMTKEGIRKALHIAPTGMFKSSVNNTRAFQYLVRHDQPYCLFGTESHLVRTRTIRLLREAALRLWGEQGDMWRDDQFELPCRLEKPRDPNLLGVTTGTAFEGMRYMFGVADDIADGKSEFSEATRADVFRWFTKTFLRRLNEDDEGKRAPCEVWGSFWSEFDILMELIKLGWETHIWPKFGEMCPREFEQYPNVHHHGGKYKHLWPERHGHLTPESYMKQELMTIQDFNLRDQCNPFGAGGRVFDPLWITERRPTEEQRARLEIYIGEDPRDPEAIAKGSEWSVVILGYDAYDVDKDGSKGVIYVLNNPAGWWTSKEVEENDTAIIEKYNIKLWTPEKSAVSGGHISWLKNHTSLEPRQINPQTPGGNKSARISSLAPYVRSGKIVFDPDNCKDLILQLLKHPGGKLKDRADTLEIGCRPLLETGHRPSLVPEFRQGDRCRGRR